MKSPSSMSPAAMMKKKYLGKLLKTYLINSDEIAQQISFTKLMGGSMSLRNMRYVAKQMQEALGEVLPLCCEVQAFTIDQMDVSIDWRKLGSKSVVVKIREMTVECFVHRSGRAMDSEQAPDVLKFWHTQAARALGVKEVLDATCAAGAQAPTLTDRVMTGLIVEAEKIKFVYRRPGSEEVEAVWEFRGLRVGPASEDWEWTTDVEETLVRSEAMQEVQQFKRMDVQEFSQQSGSGEAEMLMTSVSLQMIYKHPAAPPLMSPVCCISRFLLNVGDMQISGTEESFAKIYEIVNDFTQADLLKAKLEELLEDGPCSLMSASSTAATPTDNSFVGTAFCVSSRDLGDPEDDEAEMEGLMPKRTQWWDAPKRSRTRTADNKSVDKWLQKRKTDTEQLEAFLHIGLRASFLSTPKESPAAVDLPFRPRSATTATEGASADLNAPLIAPECAVHRTTSNVENMAINLELQEGSLSIKSRQMSMTTDTAVELSTDVRRMCADLFKLPFEQSEAAEALGAICSNASMQSLEIRFLPSSSAGGQPKLTKSATFLESEEEPFESNDTIVMRLPAMGLPAMEMKQLGPGGPIRIGGLSLQPIELMVTGLQLRVGPGTDALQAWSTRLTADVPMVPLPPDPPLPNIVYSARLLDSLVQQQPPVGALLAAGKWPVQVSIPLIEAKSISNLFEIPSVLKTTLCPESRFDARCWWLPLGSNRESGADVFAISASDLLIGKARSQARFVQLEHELGHAKQKGIITSASDLKLTEQVEKLRLERNKLKLELETAQRSCLGSCFAFVSSKLSGNESGAASQNNA